MLKVLVKSEPHNFLCWFFSHLAHWRRNKLQTSHINWHKHELFVNFSPHWTLPLVHYSHANIFENFICILLNTAFIFIIRLGVYCTCGVCFASEYFCSVTLGWCGKKRTRREQQTNQKKWLCLKLSCSFALANSPRITTVTEIFYQRK